MSHSAPLWINCHRPLVFTSLPQSGRCPTKSSSIPPRAALATTSMRGGYNVDVVVTGATGVNSGRRALLRILPKFYSILTIRNATAPEGPPNVESRGLVRTSMTVRFRRIFLVAARSGRGLLSERTAGAQPRRQERVLMPRSRHSFLRDEPALSCTADSGCGARQQSRRADERGAIGCAPGNEHLRPVRGEWRGKPEFEAVPAVAIAGGCEIGALVVGERGPKHDAVDDDLDRQRQSEFAASRAQPRTSPTSAASSQPCSVPVATVMPARRASRRHTASTFGSSSRRGPQKAPCGASSSG